MTIKVLLNMDINRCIAEISKGLYLLLRNSEMLISDARLLYTNTRYARSRFLCQTANEELSKVEILLDIVKIQLTEEGKQYRTKLLGYFERHIPKWCYTYLKDPQLRVQDLAELQELADIERKKVYKVRWNDGDIDLPNEYMWWRNSALYIDYDKTEGWQTPIEDSWIGDFVAESYLSRVEMRYQLYRNLETYGIFQPQVLSIIQSVWSNIVLSLATTWNEVDIYNTTVYQALYSKGFIADSDEIRTLILSMGFPLYILALDTPNKD